MDVAVICDLARDQTHTSEINFPNERILKYLNIIKDDFFSYLNGAIKEKYNWDIFWTDTVAGVSEYALPYLDKDVNEILKVSEIGISYTGEKYDDGTLKYVRARLVQPSNLSHIWDYYVQNQSQNDPIFYIADRSFFIAPVVNSNITDGIRVKGIRKILDYNLDTLEENMVIPIDYHGVLLQGVLSYIYKAQGKLQEASFEEQEYIRKRNEAIKELANRYNEPVKLEYPKKDWII